MAEKKDYPSGYDSSWDEYREEELAKEGDDRSLDSDEVKMRRGLDLTRKAVENGDMEPAEAVDKFFKDFPLTEEEMVTPYDDLTPEEIEKLFPNPTEEELDEMYPYFIKHDAEEFGIDNIDSVSFEVLEKNVLELMDLENAGKIRRGDMIPGMKIMATDEGPKVYPVDWQEPLDYDEASEFESDAELNASYDEKMSDLEK